MDQRLQLQAVLEATLGSEQVYYQPPADMYIQYPCIVYEMDNARTAFAGNLPYVFRRRYQITIIHEDPDDIAIENIAMLESALFERHFTANNLHHSVFTLYF